MFCFRDKHIQLLPGVFFKGNFLNYLSVNAFLNLFFIAGEAHAISSFYINKLQRMIQDRVSHDSNIIISTEVHHFLRKPHTRSLFPIGKNTHVLQKPTQ